MLKRYQLDHKKFVHVKEIGDLDGCISESPNYCLCYNRGLFIYNFSLLLRGRYPENPSISLVPGADRIFLSLDHGHSNKEREPDSPFCLAISH